jgi:hypothetical protein
VVNACVKGRFIHSTFENQGQLTVKLINKFDANTPPVLGFYDTVARQKDGRVDQGFSVIVPPNDVSHRAFRSSTTVDADDSDDFPWVFVEAIGMKASGVAGVANPMIEIEVTQNIELLPVEDDYIGTAAADTTHDSPSLREVVSTAYQKVGKEILQIGSSDERGTVSMLTKAASAAIPWLATAAVGAMRSGRSLARMPTAAAGR